ncbi:fluoride efflux transporter FluC [Tsukamurella soli]|uniref:Fluoride-specific ion channel FluC n=1 Tax=Tsukamurella soli TaxID=644556 RepID=A0ABP8K5G8_9ACTN
MTGPLVRKEQTSSRSAAPRPLHLRPTSIALVFVGGAVGTAARYGLARLLPTSPGHFAWSTFIVNMVGAFVLGVLLETLVLSGPDHGVRRHTRLLLGTGFCGGLTTYSTFMLDIHTMLAGADVGTALVYVVATITGGVLAATAGVAMASPVRRIGRGLRRAVRR